MLNRGSGAKSELIKTRMTSVENVILRASIVLGMVAAVVTVLYFTPMPDQNFKSCDRPCHDLDWPMICRVKLTVEVHQTMNGLCEDCPNNTSISYCNNNFCSIPKDALPSKTIITINGQLPGPAIQVCQNDVLVVDVVNKVPGRSLTVHWRGQPNREAPFMDGVPMVTQCPISSYTTFQYKFRASSPGTHFYHAHDDADRQNGLFGALIVRQADKIEPHRKLYDVDAKEHIVLLSEWVHQQDDGASTHDSRNTASSSWILINGRAQSPYHYQDLHQFAVLKGKRYRFRVAYASGNAGCPITVSIDKHLLKIIALDGNPTSSYEVSAITIGKGERVDFVVKTNQDVNSYALRANSNCKNKNNAAAAVATEGLALINYEGAAVKAPTTIINKVLNTQIIAEKTLQRHFNTSLCRSQIGSVCLGDVKALKRLPDELKVEHVDRQLYMSFDFIMNPLGASLRTKMYGINNFTFTYPSSPLLTQFADVPANLLCNEFNAAEKCRAKNLTVCECIHLEYVPLGRTVELVLINQGDEEENVFHLHGHDFYVIGVRELDARHYTINEIKQMDKNNKLLKRNFNNPVVKDTIRVPKYGAVAVRFVANNPGFWMLRDEKSGGWTKGMDMVLQVGDLSDLPSPPTNFPSCGSFIGPDFFLI